MEEVNNRDDMPPYVSNDYHHHAHLYFAALSESEKLSKRLILFYLNTV